MIQMPIKNGAIAPEKKNSYCHLQMWSYAEYTYEKRKPGAYYFISVVEAKKKL